MRRYPKYSKGVFVNLLDNDYGSWEKSAAFARSLKGLRHTEIWVEGRYDSRELLNLRSKLKGLLIIVHASFIHKTLMSESDALNSLSMDSIREDSAAARLLDARLLTVHAGSYPTHKGEIWAETLLKQNVNAILSRAGNMKIAIENLPYRTGTATTYPTSISQLLTLRRGVPSVQFTLDIGHCIQNGDDYRTLLRGRGGSIADIHLHDAIEKGAGHLSLGDGQLDVEEFAQILSDINYSGFISFETLSMKDTVSSWKVFDRAEKKITRRMTS